MGALPLRPFNVTSLPLILVTLAMTACGPGTRDRAPWDGVVPTLDLPILHQADPTAAAAGESYFTTDLIGPARLPLRGFRNLWLVWGGAAPSDDEGYWAAFADRYGMVEAPFDNQGYPLGLRVNGDRALVDCMACHASELEGTVWLGAGSNRFDMQGLYGDVRELAALGGQAPPFQVDDGTGAAGANDAWGLGMQLAQLYYPPPEGVTVNSTYGYQRAGAWWTLKYKESMYSDGSAPSDGHRTMMAMLLAYGVTFDEMASLEPAFEDVREYLWSLPTPAWPETFPAIDGEAAARGEEIFNTTCAECHGVHSGAEAEFPGRVIELGQIGTDPLRAERFRNQEVEYLTDFLNVATGAQMTLTATQGYLAPPLAGIWARAPYLHNGSVPTLAGLLESSTRPDVWQRVENADGHTRYDTSTVGLTYDTPAPTATWTDIEDRRIYDTARPGLDNSGHTFGDHLSETDRDDLLEYLKVL